MLACALWHTYVPLDILLNLPQRIIEWTVIDERLGKYLEPFRAVLILEGPRVAFSIFLTVDRDEIAIVIGDADSFPIPPCTIKVKKEVPRDRQFRKGKHVQARLSGLEMRMVFGIIRRGIAVVDRMPFGLGGRRGFRGRRARGGKGGKEEGREGQKEGEEEE